MEYPAVFLKARAITFSLISLFSFTWVVVICIDLFIQWGALGISEKSFLFLILASNTLTLVLLLVLLILPFRSWLDGARLMLLLATHIGIASGFVIWNSKFTCPTKTADEEGVCRLLNMYILIANWVIPSLLVLYSVALAIMAYQIGKMDRGTTDLESSKFRESRQSILPIMNPGTRHLSTSMPHASFTNRESVRPIANLGEVRPSAISTPRASAIGPPRRGSLPMVNPEETRHPSMSTLHTSIINQQRRGSGSVTDSSSPHQSILEGKRSSGKSRLSKPLPGWMYY
ncbi:hypothetical protein GYMLUDRAFT_245012 [Collybiopsis luxurians FD-317 M1]|uniref:Uncharacterized protein n=1 Tax=Collybiopsis luxurians FD-317 M1 TaxID=944289 RepID=A0A0D0BW51_9AGAR|nr:hypothetical protein GYMLUDRAFT_245012 [Collybiopsis luxurians FD-317 M1]